MKGERVIVAIDSFKGSLTSRQANQAAREALLEYGWSEAEIECIEVSDGGEGFLDADSDCVPVTVCPVSGATTDIPSANDLRPDIAAANLRRALLQTLSQGIG